MKEAEEPPPLTMQLVSVELPGLFDDYGEPVTSAAIEVIDADIGAIVSKAKAKPQPLRGRWQKIGLEAAQQLTVGGPVNLTDWHTACGMRGMKKSTRYEVLESLKLLDEFLIDENRICPISR